jgi:hypothetical protein
MSFEQVTLQYLAKLNRRRPTIAILPSGGETLSSLAMQHESMCLRN